MTSADLPDGSRIFITGGTGFFGKWLLQTLTEQNAAGRRCEAVVLSRDPELFVGTHPQYGKLPWLSFAKGDIVDADFPQGRFTHVIHAAADTSESGWREPAALFENTIIGARRALDFAVRCSATKFLLTSSGAVYGPQPTGMDLIPEDYLGAPAPSDAKSAYGQAKRAVEQLCTLYAQRGGIDITVARCFAFVGEHLPLQAHFAIGNFIHDALHGASINVKGDGTPQRSYMHGRDLARWLLTILQHGKSAHPYNVGSDRAIAIADLAKLVGNLLAPSKPVVIEQARADYAGRSRYIPNISRAREELGLDLEISLEEAILRTARASANQSVAAAT